MKTEMQMWIELFNEALDILFQDPTSQRFILRIRGYWVPQRVGDALIAKDCLSIIVLDAPPGYKPGDTLMYA